MIKILLSKNLFIKAVFLNNFCELQRCNVAILFLLLEKGGIFLLWLQFLLHFSCYKSLLLVLSVTLHCPAWIMATVQSIQQKKNKCVKQLSNAKCFQETCQFLYEINISLIFCCSRCNCFIINFPLHVHALTHKLSTS